MKCSLTSQVIQRLTSPWFLVDLSNLQHHGTQHGTAHAHGEGVAGQVVAQATMFGQKFALRSLEILGEDALQCQDLFGTQEALLVSPVHRAWCELQSHWGSSILWW